MSKYEKSRLGAVILAAGSGTRLLPYTKDLPKGMVQFQSKPLIQHQLDTFRSFDISQIGIVRGYKSEVINFPDVLYFQNDRFAETNMVHSLISARDFLTTLDGVFVSYADIVYEKRLLTSLLNGAGEIRSLVDTNWIELWKARSDDWKDDIESLKYDDQFQIREIGGKSTNPGDCKARYTGLLFFTRVGIQSFIDHFERLNKSVSPSAPWRSSPSFDKGYMTCMLQELIDSKVDVRAVPVQGGWLEFDTKDEYERYIQWDKNGSLTRFINL